MKWMSVVGVLEGESEFATMEKQVRVQCSKKNQMRSKVTCKRTPRPNTKEGNLLSSTDSLLQQELSQIKEDVGKLSLEYLSFPMLKVTKEAQFQYWQKSRAMKKRRDAEGLVELSYLEILSHESSLK